MGKMIEIDADTLRDWRELLRDEDNIVDGAAEVHDAITAVLSQEGEDLEAPEEEGDTGS